MAVSEGADLRPLATAEAVLDAVRTGDADRGLVAIENSIEGGVTATLDNLARRRPARDRRRGRDPRAVRAAGASGHGARATYAASPRTRVAARAVPGVGRRARCPRPRSCRSPRTPRAREAVAEGAFDAALAPSIAAERLRPRGARRRRRRQRRGVDPLRPARRAPGARAAAHRRRQEHAVPLHARGPPRRAARDPHRVLGPRRQPDPHRVAPDAQGARRLLLLASTARATWPTPASARRSRACTASAPNVRFLGSYPRHDGKAPLVRPGVTDADFAEAQAWLGTIRGRGGR